MPKLWLVVFCNFLKSCFINKNLLIKPEHEFKMCHPCFPVGLCWCCQRGKFLRSSTSASDIPLPPPCRTSTPTLVWRGSPSAREESTVVSRPPVGEFSTASRTLSTRPPTWACWAWRRASRTRPSSCRYWPVQSLLLTHPVCARLREEGFVTSVLQPWSKKKNQSCDDVAGRIFWVLSVRLDVARGCYPTTAAHKCDASVGKIIVWVSECVGSWREAGRLDSAVISFS